MAIIGLLLILGAGAITAGAIYDGGESATFEVFGLSADTTVGGVFMVVLATMLVFFLGVWMLFSSMGRSRRKRAERKETRNRQRQSVSQMEQERAQLRAENERLKADRDPAMAGHDGTADGRTRTGAMTQDDAMTRDAVTHDGAMSRDGTMAGSAATDSRRSPAGSTSTGAARDDGTVVDHTTDLRDHDEKAASSTSGRHRDA